MGYWARHLIDIGTILNVKLNQRHLSILACPMQRGVPVRINHADAAARAHQYLGHLDVAGPMEGSLPVDVSLGGLVPLQGFPNHQRIPKLRHGVKVVFLVHPFPAPSSATASSSASPSSFLSLLPSRALPPVLPPSPLPV